MPLYKKPPLGNRPEWLDDDDVTLSEIKSIVKQLKDNNGKITDLLINSNSLNLENYPLSGYVYPNKRIIKILGWNKD